MQLDVLRADDIARFEAQPPGPFDLAQGKLRPGLHRIMLRLAEDYFEDQQACSYYDGAIGQVENGPLVLLHVEQKKIDHAAADDAVPKISDGSSENQREGESR